MKIIRNKTYRRYLEVCDRYNIKCTELAEAEGMLNVAHIEIERLKSMLPARDKNGKFKSK